MEIEVVSIGIEMEIELERGIESGIGIRMERKTKEG